MLRRVLCFNRGFEDFPWYEGAVVAFLVVHFQRYVALITLCSLAQAKKDYSIIGDIIISCTLTTVTVLLYLWSTHGQIDIYIYKRYMHSATALAAVEPGRHAGTKSQEDTNGTK